MIKLNKGKEPKYRPWQKSIYDANAGAPKILKSRALGLTEECIVPKLYINPDFNYTSYLNELKELTEVRNRLSNL